MHLPAFPCGQPVAVGAVDKRLDRSGLRLGDRRVVFRRNPVGRTHRLLNVGRQQHDLAVALEIRGFERLGAGLADAEFEFCIRRSSRKGHGESVGVACEVGEGLQHERLLENALFVEYLLVIAADHHVVHVVVAAAGPEVLEGIDAAQYVGRLLAVVDIDRRNVRHGVHGVGGHREYHVAEVLVVGVVLEREEHRIDAAFLVRIAEYGRARRLIGDAVVIDAQTVGSRGAVLLSPALSRLVHALVASTKPMR